MGFIIMGHRRIWARVTIHKKMSTDFSLRSLKGNDNHKEERKKGNERLSPYNLGLEGKIGIKFSSKTIIQFLIQTVKLSLEKI